MSRAYSPPLAYFLTWACYGQRLHGDDRGSVDREHNLRGTAYLPPDARRVEAERKLMRSAPFALTSEMCRIADPALYAVADKEGWKILAANVRSTHVHVVVDCRSKVSPEDAMAAFKSMVTKDLGLAGLVGEDPDVWAEHGSTRWINHAAGLYGAIAYVNDWQSGKKKEWLEEQRRMTRQFLEEKRAERKRAEDEAKAKRRAAEGRHGTPQKEKKEG
ncbi:MAG: transposase [Planctomycetes bacterium]|nr:transposase [Planctomycetota bacterium]